MSDTPPPDSLFGPLIKDDTLDAVPVQDVQALVRAEKSRPEVQACYEALLPLMGEHDASPLADFLQLAILGVAVGFVERNLSPDLEQHREIVPPLLVDIREVYRTADQNGWQYNPDEFRHRAYHYGIHKASYLDWDLYLSKEMF